jgi:hypothetical protein
VNFYLIEIYQFFEKKFEANTNLATMRIAFLISNVNSIEEIEGIKMLKQWNLIRMLN